MTTAFFLVLPLVMVRAGREFSKWLAAGPHVAKKLRNRKAAPIAEGGRLEFQSFTS
jgi:uncharacterized membrane protein YbaN (DUF454 family)